jgi:hypothetical protein
MAEDEASVDSVKVGIVGSGWMGHVHSRAWRSNAPRADVVAVVDVSPERTRNLARTFDDREVATFPNLATMLAEADLDAVDICLPQPRRGPARPSSAKNRSAPRWTTRSRSRPPSMRREVCSWRPTTSSSSRA